MSIIQRTWNSECKFLWLSLLTTHRWKSWQEVRLSLRFLLHYVNTYARLIPLELGCCSLFRGRCDYSLVGGFGGNIGRWKVSSFFLSRHCNQMSHFEGTRYIMLEATQGQSDRERAIPSKEWGREPRLDPRFPRANLSRIGHFIKF